MFRERPSLSEMIGKKQTPASNLVAGSLLVMFVDKTTEAQAKQVVKDCGGTFENYIASFQAASVSCPKGQEKAVCDLLNKSDLVLSAEQQHRLKMQS